MRIKNIIRKATVAALTAVMILAPIVNVKAASSDVIDTSKTGYKCRAGFEEICHQRR